ncbi:MAG TPA: DUF3426 domain-containing protein [Candidatus Margulisiibacteriota bacterium]|nr:DUF3426 domain-containing protein [Candidatus Margulisiibacteriota bacterium]
MKRAAVLAVLLFLTGTTLAQERVRLENIKTEWQDAYGAIVYTVLANVKNVSDAPVAYVKVKVQLFDKDGKLVAERAGYNAEAEILDTEGFGGSFEDKVKLVKPIVAGGTDLFRLSLDKADIGKPFRTTKVELVAVR